MGSRETFSLLIEGKGLFWFLFVCFLLRKKSTVASFLDKATQLFSL